MAKKNTKPQEPGKPVFAFAEHQTIKVKLDVTIVSQLYGAAMGKQYAVEIWPGEVVTVKEEDLLKLAVVEKL